MPEMRSSKGHRLDQTRKVSGAHQDRPSRFLLVLRLDLVQKIAYFGSF